MRPQATSPTAAPSGIAIVVGGTVGFGLGITQELTRRGFAAVTVGRTAAPAPNVSSHYPCDVGDAQAWEAAVQKIRDTTAPVDILIYTVGYARIFPFGRTPAGEWDRHFRLNLTYVAQSFPSLEPILSPDARIATIGSQWSHRHGWPDLIPYITAKHALAALTEEYAGLFPARRFKHYCVPTMATNGYDAVRASFAANGGTLHKSSDPHQPADAMLIGRCLVNHLLTFGEPRQVMFDLSPAGEVCPVATE